MDTNIVSEYLKTLKKELLELYKIIFGDRYKKILIEPFIDKYLIVRYCNETNYHNVKEPIDRIGKELEVIYNKLVNNENEELLRSVYALFGYIIYFDEIIPIDDDNSLLKCLYEDKNIRVEIDEEKQKEIYIWFNNLIKWKKQFFQVLDTKEFTLKEKKIYKGIYELFLEQDVKISYLYSDLAINKAFTTGTTYEDTLFVLYIKTSELVLKNACGLDFSRRYIVDFAPSLWSKEKKSKQLLHVIDNVLLKKYVEIKVSCTDYENNKEYIDSLIKECFSFCIVIDDEFDGNISLLLLFSTIYIYENNEYFDIIINNREKIPGKIIVR